MDLAQKRCKPCEGGVRPLTREQSLELLEALDPAWSLSDDGLSIARSFAFPVYEQTMAFANAVAQIAATEDHHPVLTIEYGRCRVSYTTHAIRGLSDNDFICAAKIDRIATGATP